MARKGKPYISHAVACAPAPEIAALVLHQTREHHVVHLGGAINEARSPGVAIDPFENGVLRVAARAVELDCYIRGLVQGVGDLDFGHRHLLAGAVALVELPGGVHDKKAPDLDPLRHLAKLDLHAFALGKLDAEAFALAHIALCNLHAALGEAEPAHAMREACQPETYLGSPQAVAHLHQHVLVRDLEPFEHQLAVPAVLLRSHDGNAAQDAPAGLVAMKKKGGEAAPRVIGGARDQNEMLGDPSARDEPLMAIDRPAIAVAFGPGADHSGIGAAAGGRTGA